MPAPTDHGVTEPPVHIWAVGRRLEGGVIRGILETLSRTTTKKKKIIFTYPPWKQHPGSYQRRIFKVFWGNQSRIFHISQPCTLRAEILKLMTPLRSQAIWQVGSTRIFGNYRGRREGDSWPRYLGQLSKRKFEWRFTSKLQSDRTHNRIVI